MKLLWSPRSPFARKVAIVALECGLNDQVEKVNALAIFAAPPNPEILAHNPLGKIPVLIKNSGETLFDSRVICEYLILNSDRADLLPVAPDARITQLRWQALGDGLLDLLLLWRNERARADKASPVILAAFESKTRAALATLEAESAALETAPFGLGHISIACALGHLDFRYATCGWKPALPDLAKWYAEIATRPSIAATAVVDDGAGPAGASDESPSFTYEVTP